MVKDIEGKEVNIGDEVILGTSSGCSKAKIAKETIGRIHYYGWNRNTGAYRDFTYCGNKSSYLIHNMYKI